MSKMQRGGIQNKTMKRYVVIATDDSYSDRVLKEVIACDERHIMEFVKRLSFSDQISLWFFDTYELEQQGRMIFSSTSVHRLSVDNEISLKQFSDDLARLLDSLEIKEED